MRLLSLLFCLGLVVGCTLSKPHGPAADVSPITGGAIEVTPLGSAPDAAPVQPGSAQPATAQAEPAPPPPPPELPPPVLSPEEQACSDKGGLWGAVGAGGSACMTPTKDGGKQCRKESDCDGYCLARSGTCAPYTPMFGCNDIVQDNGVVVTLCLD